MSIYGWKNLFQRQIALPSEHGSWVFVLSPLLTGLLVGRSLGAQSWLVILTVMAGFLMRQPVTVLVKVLSGRRPDKEWTPALFWSMVYALLAALGLGALLWQGNSYILWFILPALPVVAWQMWLVRRRAERRQLALEVAGSGVLAMAAPVAYWTAVGHYAAVGWLLWACLWLQTSGAIVYTYLLLDQRRLKQAPAAPQRLRMAAPALTVNFILLLAALLAAAAGWIPPWSPAAYALQGVEVLRGAARPKPQARPNAIGLRMLILTCLVTGILIYAFLIWKGG
jgi:hypothetical protein